MRLFQSAVMVSKPPPNNSFKPTPLRSVVVTSSHPSVPASATLPQRRGLIQALGLFLPHFSFVELDINRERIMAWKKVESYSFGFKPSDKKYWLYFTLQGANSTTQVFLTPTQFTAVASVTLSPKLARARAGNAAAICLRPSRRIPASQARSP